MLSVFVMRDYECCDSSVLYKASIGIYMKERLYPAQEVEERSYSQPRGSTWVHKSSHYFYWVTDVKTEICRLCYFFLF